MSQILLPIDRHLPEIVRCINPENRGTDAFVLTSSPGSGKTTRLPVALLKSVNNFRISKKIVVLVPKRIAAVSAAQRICDENNWRLGEQVGYEVRFENKTSSETQLIFMTTGHFLKKILNGSFFEQIGWVIFDEFHERLLENDFLLGFCREQKILTNDLQIIVMSATLSLAPLKTYLQTENVFQIDEQPFKLDIRYSAKTQFLQCNDLFFEHLKQTARDAVRACQANLLIFLPGLREINRAQQLMQSDHSDREFLVFHGQLSLDEQKTVITNLQNSLITKKKYIVLATNICETSLTLPNTDCVIDCGLERTAQIEKNFGFSNLITQRISQFSATQRAGRAARQKDGVCFRLWHKTDERSMRESVTPEVLTKPLDMIFLYHCGLIQSDPRQFEWLSPPKPADCELALEEIKEKELITDRYALSTLGRSILSIPLDLDSAFLFYFLSSHGFAEKVCDFFARYDDLPKKRQSLSAGEDDIDFIFNLPLSFAQKQKRQQLQDLSRKLPKDVTGQLQSSDFKTALNELHFKFLKNRVFANNQKHCRSYNGVGAELESHSGASKDQFFIALQGFETEKSTQVTYAAGIKKSNFIKWTAAAIIEEQHLEFDAEKHVFYKKKIKRFGAIVINEESKQAVPLTEIQDHWKTYLDQNFEILLKDNVSYLSLKEKFHFIRKTQSHSPDVFSLPLLDDLDFPLLQKMISQHLKEFLQDFTGLKTFDLLSHLKYADISNKKIELVLKAIESLPTEFVLTSGRTCKIIYDDEKAPLISAKVQDFYGQKTHPSIFNNRISLTCELLAPNYRPTQVTKDLVRFWQESYFEIRKELKGRYPKHDWPENPQDFKKLPKFK